LTETSKKEREKEAKQEKKTKTKEAKKAVSPQNLCELRDMMHKADI